MPDMATFMAFVLSFPKRTVICANSATFETATRAFSVVDVSVNFHHQASSTAFLYASLSLSTHTAFSQTSMSSRWYAESMNALAVEIAIIRSELL